MSEVRSRAVESTPEEIAYELRAAEASIWTGTRLLVGVTTFAFASLAFAYFYLRSSNNENLWRPGGITAPTGLGAAIAAVIAASAVLFAFGRHRLRAGVTLDWMIANWIAVVGGLIGVGLQIYELTQLPFYPGSSGYASCFIGWASLNIAVLVVCTYWIETVIARLMRLRSGVHGAEVAENAGSTVLLRANIEGCTYFWGYLGLVEVLFWVLFYVV